MTLRWLVGIVARRRGRVLAAAAGVAVTVALIASIGAFLAGSTASMTDRALARVPLDWQVQASPGASFARVVHAVRAFPGVKTALPVRYAMTTGYRASAGGVTTNAGPGLVLGVPDGYRAAFPRELRQFVGARTGVLIAQQMAANLGVGRRRSHFHRPARDARRADPDRWHRRLHGARAASAPARDGRPLDVRPCPTTC